MHEHRVRELCGMSDGIHLAYAELDDVLKSNE